jgi:hypothetical protein
MKMQVEDDIYRIIYRQNQEAKSGGKIDNSSKISDLLDSSGLVAECNCDPNPRLEKMARYLAESSSLSEGEQKKILGSENPESELFLSVYRPRITDSPTILANWALRGALVKDPSDRSIRYLYLSRDGATFSFQFQYFNVLDYKTCGKPGEVEVKQWAKHEIESVWLTTNPLIKVDKTEFPKEGEFGHLRWNCGAAMPHRREFMLYPKEEMYIPYFDARLIDVNGEQAIQSLDLGLCFGAKEKYVDRCLNLLYDTLTRNRNEIASPSPSL